MAKLIELCKLVITGLAIALLSGCANDLIIDLGKGNEVRLVGHADNFDCTDTAYAKVNKVHTFHMVFADGSTKTLCRDADLPPPVLPKMRAVPVPPSARSIQTETLPAGHSGVRQTIGSNDN